ncbi:MAG: retroviral-like aspartic protease [Deltaproteobacteria bacterium]|nr:retroviral-like aspartic protease [Deltaproteobacteria bacterium]
MPPVEKPIELVGSKASATVLALFDSGASVSCIDRALAERLGTPVALPRPRRFGTAERGRELVVDEGVHLDFRFKGLDLFADFFVVAALAEQVIVGAQTLHAWRMKLDFEHDDVLVDPRVARLRLVGLQGA